MLNGPGWKTAMSDWNPTVEPAVTAIVEVLAAFAWAPTLQRRSVEVTSVTGELVLVFWRIPTYSPPTVPALMNL